MIEYRFIKRGKALHILEVRYTAIFQSKIVRAQCLNVFLIFSVKNDMSNVRCRYFSATNCLDSN